MEESPEIHKKNTKGRLYEFFIYIDIATIYFLSFIDNSIY